MALRRNWITGCACLGLVGVALIASRVIAEDMKDEKTSDAKQATGAGPSAADMAAMAELAKPGPQHVQLAKYAGDFTADVQMWMDPSQPVMKSTGKLHNEMVMGGRFLMGNYEGTMMGQTFHGMSCTGYDNGKKKWCSGWIDDMSTGMLMTEGDADASGKVVTTGGDMYCPMTKGMMKIREVMTFVDDDTMKFEMYAPGPDGKEMKSMEITYNRVK